MDDLIRRGARHARDVRRLLELFGLVRRTRSRSTPSVRFVPMPDWWVPFHEQNLPRYLVLGTVLLTGGFVLLGLLVLRFDVVFTALAVGAGVLWVRHGFCSRFCLVAPSFGSLKSVDSMSGEAFEQFIAKVLSAHGYCCRLTPAGGDFGLDVIAEMPGRRLGVQCKRYTGSVGVAAVREAVSGCMHYGLEHPVVITTGTFTRQARALALTNGCVLMGRPELADLVAKRDTV